MGTISNTFSDSKDNTTKSMASTTKNSLEEDVLVVPTRGTHRKGARVTGSPTETTNASAISNQLQTQKPVKGERIRVYYDKGDDMFGKERVGGRGWQLGVIHSVKENKLHFQIEVLFDTGDKSMFEYPDKDQSIERLRPSQESANVMVGEFSGNFACDQNPAILDVGDLVQCLYQNGRCGDSWYRGRIAAISEDNLHCDIAYDDHEVWMYTTLQWCLLLSKCSIFLSSLFSFQYELDVPIGEGKIMLLEDGRLCQHWLDGLEMQVPNGKSKRKSTVTLKVREGGDIVSMLHTDGSIETKGYSSVVRVLFDRVKENARTLVWSCVAKAGTIRSVNDSSKAKKSSKRKATYERPANKKKTPIIGTGLVEACEPEDFIVDPWLSDSASDEEEREGLGEALLVKEMTNSLRNTCWKALNSAEGPYGADLLFIITNFHNKMPNDELCRDLISLLWKGSTHANGRIHFPDCVRMELAKNYFDLVKTKSEMGEKLAGALPDGFLSQSLDIIMEPASHYCVGGDESRTTSAALQRIGQTLNLKNCGANLLCYLLQSQLKGYEFFKASADPSRHKVEEFQNLLKSRPLVGEILRSNEGVKGALKRTVRASFSVFIHYGHYLSNDFVFPDSSIENCVDDPSIMPAHATPADRSFVAAETRQLVKTMGKIVGYMAWLWSIDEGQSIYGATDTIVTTVIGQLRGDFKFDPLIFLSKFPSRNKKEDEKRVNRHWADMKFQFAASLDKRIAGKLGKKVATDFRVTTKYF